jgi:hypothetical protein
MKGNPMKTLCLIILTASLGAGCGKTGNSDAGKPKPLLTQPKVVEKPNPTESKPAEPKPNPPAVGPQELIASPIVENAIRQQLKKPKGELTQADLEKVTELNLEYAQITDAGLKEVAKLQQLTTLYLARIQITDAGVAELQKALPKCIIIH